MNVNARLKLVKVKLREISVPSTSPSRVLIGTDVNTHPSRAHGLLVVVELGFRDQLRPLLQLTRCRELDRPPDGGRSQDPGQHGGQAVHVLFPMLAELMALDRRHAGQARRQVPVGGHGGGLEENGDECSLLMLEPVLQLPEYSVLLVLEPIGSVRAETPIGADKCHDGRRALERGGQPIRPALRRIDRLAVDEDGDVVQLLLQDDLEEGGALRGVAAPVAQENALGQLSIL